MTRASEDGEERSEFNSTAFAELRFHCAVEFCVCLAIFWLTWPTPGTPVRFSPVAWAPRVVLTKIDGARPPPPSIYRPRHALVFPADNSLRARDVFGRADIASLILRDKSGAPDASAADVIHRSRGSIYAPARRINCIGERESKAFQFDATSNRARRQIRGFLIVFRDPLLKIVIKHLR